MALVRESAALTGVFLTGYSLLELLPNVLEVAGSEAW